MFKRTRFAGLLVCTVLATAGLGQAVTDQPKLTYVESVSVPAVEKFAAAQAFNQSDPAGLHVLLNGKFSAQFLGETSENVPKATLEVHRLQKAALDQPIIDELGKGSETKLVRVYELVEQQAKGQPGPLLTDGNANIFYIRDPDNDLWAVDVYWDPVRGWHIDASSIDYPVEWYGGDLVFSRK